MLTTTDKRWLLLKPGDDGSPLRWLTDQQIRELLADPRKWGVGLFRHVDDMDNDNPNYWSHGTGVLLRVEVVVPERGGWRLPGEEKLRSAGDPESDGRWMPGSGPVTLADVHDTPLPPSGYDLIKGDLRGEAA